ncbi:Peptidase S8/S53 [Gracilaria domingensis]|nr:Peptidase S8/S53 [Gracilaria domingensis]
MPLRHIRSHIPPRPSSLIPKDVTRVSALVNSSGADGSGITVAVLDTGVDPGAPGLSYTTDNKRKIVDIVDCTASGDVITTTSITLASSENTIQGLSGRTLTVPQHIIALNPSRVFKLGIKQGYELFPSTLISRLRKERRAAWDKHLRGSLNCVRQQLYQQNERKIGQPSVEELEARQAVLLSMDKAYVDYGPLYDVLVFHDGTRWRAVVDTSENGNLEHCDVLEDYAVHGNYSQFGGGVMMNFGINIYEDGDLVSIVVDGGSHGTHVAGILAAHFSDSPHLNGLAPGARIVSLKIGDSRLSSMETHQGAMRALAYVLNHSGPSRAGQDREEADESLSGDGSQKGPQETPNDSHESLSTSQTQKNCAKAEPIRIDVCNMSFGEHSRDVNQGRFVTSVETLVNKHNVLFLSSAGNEGPGLSSVSAPGGTTDSIIGVGAYVTPSMLTEAYSLLHSEFGDYETSMTGADDDSRRGEASTANDPSAHTEQRPVVALPYTWSSRGPTWDGAMGVSICSPGGAIAPVPLWMLRKKMLLNGTSMSSPSAAGAVAVVLSFLKSRKIPYTSALIRRALENTARPLKSPSYSLDPKAKRITSESHLEEQKSKFDSEYYHDIVFAAGYGSVDALAACQYIERYMSSRRVVSESELQNTVPHRTRAAEAVATSLLEVSDSAIEKHQEKKSSNGPTKAENGIYYRSHENCGDSTFCLQDWCIKVKVEDGSPARRSSSNPGFGALNTTRGIYLRGASQTSSIHKASISIELVPGDEECVESKKALADMEVVISLHCSASWVEVPSTMLLLGAGRSFSACIDPTKLTSGRAHFAEVVGMVFNQGQQKGNEGPVFRVPIAVHKPEPLVDGVTIKPLRDLSFAPGSVIRRFYDAPIGATYALLRINTGRLSLPVNSNATGLNSSIHGRLSEEASAVEFSELSSNPSQPDELGGFPLVKRHRARSAGEQRSDSSDAKMHAAQKKTSSESTGIAHTNRPASSRITGAADARSFEVHVVQLGPRKHCGELESRQFCTLRPGMVKELIIQVKGGSTLELCLAQLWSSPGDSIIESVDLAFGGLLPSPSSLCVSSGASCFPHVEVTNFLEAPISHVRGVGYISGYAPRGSMNKIQRTVSPSSSKLRALVVRDIFPEKGTMFQLELQYEFDVYDSSSIVRLLFPGLNGAVYEAEVEGGPYVTVHDRNKQFMCASDIYPREISLGKGEYSATAYLRHDKVDVLEKLRDLGVTVQYDMSSPINLEAFDSSHAASLSLDQRRSSKATTTLECGERRAFYFAVPKRSSFPKWVAVGDIGIGQMSIDKVLSASSSSSRRGNYVPSYPISFFIGPLTSSSKGENKTSREKNKSKEGADDSIRNGDDSSDQVEGNGNQLNGSNEEPDKWFEDAARKLRLKRLRSLLKESKFSTFDTLCTSLREKYQEDTEFLLLNLERHDVHAARLYRKDGLTDSFREIVDRIVQIADTISRNLNPTAVATHFGMMVDTENSEEVSRRKQFETKRAQLIEALFRKTRALCLCSLPNLTTFASNSAATSVQSTAENGQHEDCSSSEHMGKDTEDKCEQAFKDLIRWVTLDGKGSMPGSSAKAEMRDGSTTSEDLALLGALREVRRGQLGFALRVLDNYYGGGSSRRTEAQIVITFREALFGRLGWTQLADRERDYARVRYPKHFAPF